VLRSKHNRRLGVGQGGVGRAGKRLDHLRTLPGQGRRLLSAPERDGRPARETTAAVARAAVAMPPSKGRRCTGRRRPPRVWALRASPVTPPASGEAVEWFLLTNLPVETVGQAWEKVDGYGRRRVIEEFHKGQKTGCAIEGLQFQKVARLRPMIALLSVVATALLALRDLSRDAALRELPATGVVDEECVDVPSGWRDGRRRGLTVAEFFRALARLGGRQGRRGDGEPGWLVLWRGWSGLRRMAAGARAARCPKDAPPEERPPETGR